MVVVIFLCYIYLFVYFSLYLHKSFFVFFLYQPHALIYNKTINIRQSENAASHF